MIKKLLFFSLVVIFLSGCATVQLMDQSFLRSPPPVVVIGDITPASEKVKIPQEEIGKGREIIFEVFKKELPEFTILKTIQDLPAGLEDYLLVETKITFYQESKPYMAATVFFAGYAMSSTAAEMTVTKYREKVVVLRFPNSGGAAGFIYGKDGAYRQILKQQAEGLARNIKKYAGR